MNHPPQISTLETRLEHQNVVLFRFGNIVRQHVQLVCRRIDVLSIRRRVLTIVYDQIDKGLSVDDRLHLALERLLENIVFRKMDCFVGFVGSIEFRLAGEEYIISDAELKQVYLLKGNSSLGGLLKSELTFYIVFY